MKYLLLVLVLYVVWRIWAKGRSRPQQPRIQPAPEIESMVICPHCHVYLPQGEGVREGEAYYCCEAHRKAGPRSGSA